MNEPVSTPADSLAVFITPEQRAAIRAPIAQAQTLPRQAFTDETFFALEIQRIFSRQWTALCFAEQVPDVGDCLPLEFARIPLVVVRGDDQKVRVFHNIVPYDGCLAVTHPEFALETIRTPYHGWRYDLRGQLLEIPFWDGHQDADLGALNGRSGHLVEVPSAVQLGVVFINLDGQAEPLEQQLDPLLQKLADYQIEDLAVGLDAGHQPAFDVENLATNWKTHYENWALNVLHEGFTHEVYAQSSQIPRVNAQGEKTYVEHIDRALMALSYRERDFEETYELEELPLSHLGRDEAQLPECAFIGSLFPNLHLAVFPYFIHLIIALPISAEHTRTLRTQLYRRDSAENPEFIEIRQELQAEFQLAGREDGRITEAVQKARHSPAFQQQFYAPFWDNMHYRFSNQVLDALENP